MNQPTISLVDAQRPLFVGVDVGGTNIKIGLVDNLGRTIDSTAIETLEERGPDEALGRIAKAATELLAGAKLDFEDVAAIGLGTPGTMDIPAGMMLEPPNMPHWSQFPIRDRLSAACGRPVVYANDAAAAAFGEFWIGSGKSFHSIVMLTLGTGVGGGIIIGDISIDGVNSHGAECGHIIIDSSPTARICGCGQAGHLEAYASATALVKRAEEALAEGRQSSLGRRVSNGQPLSGLMLAEEAESGDPLARELIMDTADYISIGVATLVHTIDPGAVVIGGAMTFGGNDSMLGREFLARICNQVKSLIFPTQAANITIDFATLGGDAGYIGAAGIARTAWRKNGVVD